VCELHNCSDWWGSLHQLLFVKNKQILWLSILGIFLTETRNQSYQKIIAIAIAIQHLILSCLPILCYILILHQLLRVHTDWVTEQHWRQAGVCYGGTSTQTLSKSIKNLNPCLYQILPHLLLLVCCHRIWFMLRYILVWNLFSQLIINEMQTNTKCLWYCRLSTTESYENI